jgi:hypothetical protein
MARTFLKLLVVVLALVLPLTLATFIPLAPSHPIKGGIVNNRIPIEGSSILNRRGEVNPVSAKFMTRPDPGMPPPMDFNVLAKRSLSSWDDDKLTLTSEMFLPGQFQARVPIANGYVCGFLEPLSCWTSTF